MTPLRGRLIDELTRRNYSPNTVEAYVAGVARAARHFNRPPDQLTADDLRAFQLALIAAGASWSQFNQVTAALRFFYRHALDRPDLVPFVPYGKKPRTLPVVLSPDQVARLLAAVPPGRYRLLFRIAYGCGLRVSELTHLRVAVHRWCGAAGQLLCFVRHGKGCNSTAAVLRCPDRCPGELRARTPAGAPAEPDWLFPGRTGRPAARGPAGVPAGHAPGRRSTRGDDPHAAALLRHPPAGGRDRPAHPPAAPRPPPPVHHPRLPPPAGRPDAALTSGPRWNDWPNRVSPRAM